MPELSTILLRLFVPGPPVGLRPLEDLEVPILGHTRGRHFVPGVLVGPCTLQDREVPAASRNSRENGHLKVQKKAREKRCP